MILIWPQLLGLRAKLLAAQFAEDDLQPTPRFLRRRQRPLMLAQGCLRLCQKRFSCSFSSRSAAMLMRYFEHIATAHATFKIAPESICRSYPAAGDAALLPGGPTSNPAPRTGLRTSLAITHYAVCDRWPNELAPFEALMN